MTGESPQPTAAKQEKTHNYVRLEIPSQARYVGMVREIVYRLCRENGFGREAAFDLKLVCGEALNNVIKHAYAEKSNQPIFVELYVYPDHAELRVRDVGKQIPVHSNMAKDLSDYRERGLGLYLIGRLTDYHYFDQTGAVGTKLTVKKRLS